MSESVRTVQYVSGGPSPARGQDCRLAVLWGKSNAGPGPNLLVQHLFDTAAVGELVWDQFLASSVRDGWDRATGGRGRVVFCLLCGLHDVGKATPAFQSKVPLLAEAVTREGLTWRPLSTNERAWHHTVAGARILREHLRARTWDNDAVAWVWPFVAGHHGKVPGLAALTPPGLGNCHGLGEAWHATQAAVVDGVAAALGIDLQTLGQVRAPSRAAQLALLGALVMADWVASSEDHFPGIADYRDVGMAAARQRANQGWTTLGLRGGWQPTTAARPADLIGERFGVNARQMQTQVLDLAEAMTGPGLLLVEAPMGEGKTEAALAAAEVLARRFGADGVYVGMPTQATSDPMFSRVRRWAQQVDPDVPVALLHGKARLNPEWRALRSAPLRITGVDEFGCADPYGASTAGAPEPSGQAPAEWFLGRNRGLLTPVAVGTIDQLLHAATRTRHVMLRHAGLAGKVVVLDEVHAYDVYMSQFLHEALRWLAGAGVPVIVLSATLPPVMRTDLVRAYLQGALAVRDVPMHGLPTLDDYPAALGVTVRDGNPDYAVSTSQPWRDSQQVGVEILEEPEDDTTAPLVRLLTARLAHGGCALVVRNTVTRAQATYSALRPAFGEDVVLLHARLTAGERADRTQAVLSLLGPPGADRDRLRPKRLLVVATQLAEQSFDVDVDMLVSDLAPIDLLLQRAGRLHRHHRPEHHRPATLRQPRIVLTGIRRSLGAAPSFPAGSRYVYGDHPLLRAAVLVEQAEHSGGWSIPADVPNLVASGYAEQFTVPPDWSTAAEAALSQWRQEQALRVARAQQFLLAGEDTLGTPTLAGLHQQSITDLDDDEKVSVVVRDGDTSVEVVLVTRTDAGYATLDGRPLGPTGEAVTDPDMLERVLRDSVRLPARPDITAAATTQLLPLPGWATDPWLARTRALVLDPNLTTELGNWQLRYDHHLGLVTRYQGGQ